jgi:MFS family permease
VSKNNVFHPIDYIKITIFGFALTAMWSSLHTFVLQLRLLDFVAESQKNTYLGLLTFAGLVLAMLVQPIAGAISDHWGFRWGRRRPYILMGTALVIILLPGIGLVNSFIGLLIIYCLLQVSSNTAQGPFQAFIPDMVPGKKRGVASGVKGLLELAGGLVLVSLLAGFMGRYFAGEGKLWLWSSLSLLDVVLLAALLVTMFTVKEHPWVRVAPPPLLPTLDKSFKIDLKVSPGFVTFLVSRLLIVMAIATLQTFALYFSIDVLGITNLGQVTVYLLIVAGICMIGVVYPAGWLSDRIGRRPVVIASSLLGALGVLLLLLVNSYPALIVAGALLGVSGGAFFSSNWALATDLVPKGEEARYLGLANLATAGGSALARLIGIAIDPLNAYTHGLGYQVMLAACLIYFIIGSALLFKLKEPANRGNSAALPNPEPHPRQ